ncbi:hypothetical protein TNCV_3335831 [Trichonephila clavipes]|nr:hypothetical protein TNCV_3335831 [Trichonephila clavipes]
MPRKQLNVMGKRIILEHCVPRVVPHYPVVIWLMESKECVGGSRAPTPQICGAGCSMYRQSVLERYGAKFEYHPKP